MIFPHFTDKQQVMCFNTVFFIHSLGYIVFINGAISNFYVTLL